MLLVIGNVQINYGVIWHFVLSFSYLLEMLELNTKVNNDFVVS